MSSPPTHELLIDQPGKRACLLGNLAIVRGALEAGVQFFSCYPGTPSSELGDTFAKIGPRTGLRFEYSINEKIAVEVAFGASLAGARSMCGMKHLGLNYAADPLSTMPYVGVEGGMAIVSAGDPSLITSPNEQDQRHLTNFLFFPVLDPATPEDALEMTRFAFHLSEQTRLPVIIRPTTRVCHSSGMVEFGSLPTERNELGFDKNPPRYVPIPSNARRMRAELTERFHRAEQLLADSTFFPRTGSGKRGIIASGVAYAYATQVLDDLGLHDTVSLQQVGGYPIPQDLLADFLAEVESVLVVEELTPFVEDWVSRTAFHTRCRVPVYGKRSAHFPTEFEYSPDIVEDAVRDYLNLDKREIVSVNIPDLPPRPPVLCPGCPHRVTFYLLRKVFGNTTVYCNDIGCYTLGYGEPLQACDMLLCMGSSITQACGVARTTGRRTVAYIGDSTFFHSGLPALLNAIQANDSVTVVVLDNYITAMTGFQPSLTTDAFRTALEPDLEAGGTPAPTPRFSIESAARGLGVSEIFSVNPFHEDATLAALSTAKNGTGVNVIVCHAPCVVQRRRIARDEKRLYFTIDPERCNACSTCIRLLGCPGITVLDGRYEINDELCDGCAICAYVCPQHAITPHHYEETDERRTANT
ncbi:MAG: indolepyruvate ferredoxin oxidoreductase subunit alpha [Phycisphaerae bacterium]|jgi:indolepyruvate ferredoxin oxidoreductase alpha subunit